MLDLHKHTIKIFSHCFSIHYKNLTIPFPRPFLSSTYLSLPHLPCQQPCVLHFVPFYSSTEKRNKNFCLNRSMIWIRQREQWVTNRSLHSFIYILTYIHLAQERYLGMGCGWRVKAWQRWKQEVCRKGGLRNIPPPPTSLHGESHRNGSFSNGLCRSLVQKRRNGKNYCRNAFLLRVCWDLISGNGREVRNAVSVCLFVPNWSWEDDEWVQQHPTTPPPAHQEEKNPPHDKFTRHHFLRVLVKGFEEFWQRDSRKAKQHGRKKSASESVTNESK